MNTTKWQASLMPVLQERLAARECASNGGVLFSFTGAVDADMIPHLIPMVERSLNHSGGSRKEVKRVMNVVIESVQNVLHHGYIDDEGEILLYLTVEQTPLGFQVHCGNLMEQEACDVLCDRVAEVNGMDRALLRKTYIDVLCAGEADALRGNAGLLEYLVENHSECGLQLFTLTTTIKR